MEQVELQARAESVQDRVSASFSRVAERTQAGGLTPEDREVLSAPFTSVAHDSARAGAKRQDRVATTDEADTHEADDGAPVHEADDAPAGVASPEEVEVLRDALRKAAARRARRSAASQP